MRLGVVEIRRANGQVLFGRVLVIIRRSLAGVPARVELNIICRALPLRVTKSLPAVLVKLAGMVSLPWTIPHAPAVIRAT